MSRKQKKMLWRILAAGALFLLLGVTPLGEGAWWPLYLIPYGLVGWDVLLRAGKNMGHGQLFDEHFLMSVATIGAFACGQAPEAVAVMLFYQVGELFQSVAVGRSRRSIAGLMELRPDWAYVERAEGLCQVDPEEVAVGEVIQVRPGERIPLDGEVVEGSSSLDTAALTGESVPRAVGPGEQAASGCVNLTGLLRLRVSRPYADSTVAKILDLVENAGEKKARAEQFITRFARYYTPVVVWAAVALAVFPPLLGMGPWMMWVQRALNFLVVSCPCALVISIPLTFFGGIGGASRRGILVKGGNYLEGLAKPSVVAFDKTGTLTRGIFSVTQVCPAGVTEEELLLWAAAAEQSSNHPVARCVVQACPQRPLPQLEWAEELAGRGVRSGAEGHILLAGSRRLLEEAGIPCPEGDAPGTVVYVARDGQYLGRLTVADQPKEGAAQALKDLKAAGVSATVLLTGDNQAAGQAVGQALGIDQVYAQLLPGDKVAQVERLLQEKAPGTNLVYVGDGINDAPVLTRADIGVAMGAMGSDAAIEAADVVLMDDDLSKLAEAIRIARRTVTIARENLVLALGIKGLVLALSAVGYANLWMAVFADVGVTVLAILNAARMLYTPKSKA